MFRKRKQLYFYLLSFLLPIVFLNLIFNLKHMYPFGPYSLLQEDLNYQYINYLSYFRDSLLSGNFENFLYSFSMSLGSNMSGLDSYYFMNPLFIILLMFKSTNILLAIYIITNISIGLMGISMLFYCLHSKIHRTNLFFSLVLSISYALMSYNLAYLSNLMWLTDIVMLPLICYGIEKIILENKGKWFFFSLAFSILFNYYIGYMICLFSFLYFIYIWSLNHSFTFKDVKSSIRSFIKYASLSISSVLVNMFLLLPTIVATAAAKSSNTQTDFSFNSITNPFLNLRSLFIVKSTQYGVPNIYCGLFIVTLVILYFFNERIAKREKVISMTFILLMYACFQFQILNLIWHIFKSPLGFPHRFSFLFSFLLIIVSIRALNQLDMNTLKQNYKKTFIFISFAILFTTVALYYGSIATGIKRMILSLLIYAIYLVLLRCVLKNSLKWIAEVSMVIVLAGELISTGVITNEEENSHFKTQEFVNYIENNQPVFQYIKNKDSGFYRTEKNYKRLGMEASLNDSLLFNYYGISHYSSSLGIGTRQSLGKLGYTSFDTIWPSWINYNNGSTIAADTLMGLKYVISDQERPSNGNLLFYNSFHSIDHKFIYENPYFVGIGFLSQSQVVSSRNSSNTFDYQNKLWKSIGSKGNIFSPINLRTKLYNTRIVNNHMTKVDNAKESYLEISYKTNGNPEYLYFENQNEFIQSNTNIRIELNNRPIATYPVITNNGIIPLSTTATKNKKVTLKLVLNSSDNVIPKVKLYRQNNSTFNSIIKRLKQNPLQITKHSNTRVSGTISSNDKNRFLFLSIPYDKDWNITVNDHRVTPHKAVGNLMTVPLDRGLNRVQIVYRNHDLLIGSIISIISLICLLLVWLFSFLLTRKRSI